MSEKVKGVAPGFLLLPAREYEWVLDRKVELRIPNKGKISQLLKSTEFAAGVSFPGEDDFSLFEDNVLLLWQIVQVLFADIQYPQLKDNQCLNVVALEFDGDDIVLYGEIITSL